MGYIRQMQNTIEMQEGCKIKINMQDKFETEWKTQDRMENLKRKLHGRMKDRW